MRLITPKTPTRMERKDRSDYPVIAQVDEENGGPFSPFYHVPSEPSIVFTPEGMTMEA